MLKTLHVLRRWCLSSILVLPKDMELLVLFHFIASWLSTAATVVLVDTVAPDAGIFSPSLSFHNVMLHVIHATVAP